MLTIGITAIGSGVGQPVLDSLRDSSLEVQIIGFEANPWAKGAYECDVVYRLPFANHPEYAATLQARCREAGVDLLIPGSDAELVALAQAAPDLESIGCRVVVSSPECVRVCRDKLVLHHHLRRAGVPFASTWSLEEARAQVDNLPYPLIVKPRGGSGSIGVRIIFQPSDWERFPLEGDLIVQTYLIPAAWYDDRRGIKPYLEQLASSGMPLQRDELSIQVMISKDGKLLGRFASLNRLKSGVPMQLDPIDDKSVWAAAERFVNALIPLGLKGPCNLQARKTRNGIVFFEANPRFTGITHVRALMGYNEVESAVRHFLLEEDERIVRRCLKTRTDKVGLRQMTEIVVPRIHLDRLVRNGKLDSSLPCQQGPGMDTQN
ncbi:MAG: ATP-grasp domain-containing protein [Chloroflexi bacterium]|nr:ATP-grasp domain-containing protein [Chloroflexota bacterium]